MAGTYQAQYYNEALLHYGVKGMRWGVRKKRETKGRRRKSKKDDAKEKRYVKKATKQASTEGTNVALSAIAFGCTALAVGFFFADTAHRESFKKAVQYVADTMPNLRKKRPKTIKGDDVLVDVRELTHKIAMGLSPDRGLIIPKGQNFSRITKAQNPSLKNQHGGIYAAFSKRDIKFYRDHYLSPRDGKGARQQVIMKAIKDLHIPSRPAAEDLYQNLMKNDKNYRKDVNRAMYRMLYKRHVGTYGDRTGEEVRKAIQAMWKENPDGFYIQNTVLTNKGKAYKKYARALKKAGYDGVLDYHDIDDGLTVAPIILTNKAKLQMKRKRKL